MLGSSRSFHRTVDVDVVDGALWCVALCCLVGSLSQECSAIRPDRGKSALRIGVDAAMEVTAISVIPHAASDTPSTVEYVVSL